MKYKTIHTEYGLNLLARAEATGSKIEITHMAVGDGRGNPITPDPKMQQLVRERFRAKVNRVFNDPENKNLFTAELIIPVETESFVVREIAIFDRNGNMIMIGNTPEAHKPSVSDGAFTDAVYRVPFVVSNSETIELKIDPNVVVATHSWIINTLTVAYFLPGGVTGQILKKNSNLDGDVGWGNAETAEVFVTTIEEEQSLVDDQITIDLTIASTDGASVYIDGKRITKKNAVDGWNATSSTQIILGKPYPGSKVLIVQNEPVGDRIYPLGQQNNLSDVADPSLARSNLGVMSSDEAKYNDCPPGTIITLASPNIPNGYRLLKCNGAAYSRTIYADLFSAIGTYYGHGDGVNTFNVPEARGEFPRYADDGRGIDMGRAVGSKQGSEVQEHSHTIETGFDATNYNGPIYRIAGGDGAWNGQIVEVESGKNMGKETRPRNLAVLACIRY